MISILKYINYIFVICAIFFTVYDFIKSRYSKNTAKIFKISIRARLDLIIILISTYVISSTLTIDLLSQKQLNNLPSVANYYDNQLREQIKSIEEGIRKKQVIFDNSRESMFQLLKIVDNAEKSYTAINTYTAGWNKGISSLSYASIAAAKRGLEISRCFVIKNDYFEDELQDQFSEMEREYLGGVKVFYVREDDIKKMPYFRENNLRSMSLVDSKILVTDTSPLGATGTVTSITVSWDNSKVSDNPFGGLKRYKKEFDPKTFIDLIGQKAS